MIAMALACDPELLIADEPTTALDVTIQAQILDLMRSVAAEVDTALILITHDLGVVAGMCRITAVMYAGRIVERAETTEIFGRPRHPYTVGLLRSLPRLDESERGELVPIKGQPPDMSRTSPAALSRPAASTSRTAASPRIRRWSRRQTPTMGTRWRASTRPRARSSCRPASPRGPSA